MIVKLLSAAGNDFPGVQYNERKIKNSKGELMLLKNFPSSIDAESGGKKIRNFLKAISSVNPKIKNPQFHAVISTKSKSHSKEELTAIAQDFMEAMKYGKQPYLVVFHKDTEHNHVHLVSTRVDGKTGRKINDSYEKLNSQRVMAQIMKERYGIDELDKLDQLLKYNIGSYQQLETLLKRNGYHIGENTNDGKHFTISKNGNVQRRISKDQIVFHNDNDGKRIKQIRAILSKYKEIYSNKVFRVDDYRKMKAMHSGFCNRDDAKPQVEYESELQKKLRDSFGIDIVFHHSEDKTPFGYTVIDHRTGSVFKGSQVMKMGELFALTSKFIDKKLFEQLKEYGIPDDETKDVLLAYLKSKHPESELSDFMLFMNKKFKKKEVFAMIKSDVKMHITDRNDPDVSLLRSEDGTYYAVHSKYHFVGGLKSLIGEIQYERLMNPAKNQNVLHSDCIRDLKRAANDMFFDWMTSSGPPIDPAEKELKKRRKKR